jgi:hypothetical protein
LLQAVLAEVEGEVNSWPLMGDSTTVSMFWKTLPSART